MPESPPGLKGLPVRVPFAHRALQSRIMRFAVTGGLNTLVHFVIFALLLACGAGVTAANVLAFIAANLFGFVMASVFVFKVPVAFGARYPKFLLLSLAGVFISWGVAEACVRFDLHPYAAVLGTAAIVPPVSYLLQRALFTGGRS